MNAKRLKPMITFLLMTGLLLISACGDKGPQAIELPANSIERAAVQGLHASYRDSTMWQIQNPRVISTALVAPNAMVVQDHDPKELYCVCIEYEARYKVGWTTAEASPWERTVRNVLVMRTQADTLMAMRPLNICPAFCE